MNQIKTNPQMEGERKKLTPYDIITFGKYEGSLLKNIYRFDPEYLSWCISNVTDFIIDIPQFENLPKPTSIKHNFHDICFSYAEKTREASSANEIAAIAENLRDNPFLKVCGEGLDRSFDYTKNATTMISGTHFYLAVDINDDLLNPMHPAKDFPISYFMNHSLYYEAVALMEETDFSFTEEEKKKCGFEE